jgi:hypothetical protein
LRRSGLVVERRDGRFVFYALSTERRARRVLGLVLSELASDPAIRADREMTARVLSLPHEVVCERGRKAVEEAGLVEQTGRRPNRSPCAMPHTKSDPKEVP